MFFLKEIPDVRLICSSIHGKFLIFYRPVEKDSLSINQIIVGDCNQNFLTQDCIVKTECCYGDFHYLREKNLVSVNVSQ